MEKRAILAIVLSIIVLLLYQKLFIKEKPRKPGERKATEKVEPMPPAPKVLEGKAEGESRERPVGIGEGRPGTGEVAEDKEKRLKDVRVETKLYSATFSHYGGTLKSWRLSRYMNRVEYGDFVRWFQETENKVRKQLPFLRERPVAEGEPEPVDLVTTVRLENLPLAIEVYDEKGRVNFAPMDVDREKISLGGSVKEGTLLFRGISPGGLELSRGYRFSDDTYRVEMEVRIKNRNARAKEVRAGLVWFGKVLQPDSRAFSGPVAMVDGQVQEIKEKKFRKEELSLSGDITWFGDASCGKNVPEGERKPFFVSLVVPKESEGIKLGIGMKEGNVMYSRAIHPARSVSSGGELVYAYELYLGPKVIDLLKELNVGAEKGVRFGWFTAIAKVLLLFINFTHKITKNYGADIIIISVLLKILFWPLTKKSYKSMKEMQKVQPEMTMLREKYKDDKTRLNRELMDLYKRRKINPLGGCLPMVVQIPIFFALYWALMGSIELRHAPFILWIKDLSYRDPIYISPILMGASMVWQQKMTPTAGDPRQAKMMMIMPIVFTFLFLSFPAGLVIYWLITNILTIGQQYLINKAMK
jgi:YidC/Oxa1 family membrane protein insertase